MQDFTVVMDPKKREKEIQMLLYRMGLSGVEEDPNSCYCGLALTTVPEDLKKPVVGRRQNILMELISQAGLKGYDPASSEKYSPDLNQDADHREVYAFDKARVAAARYFAGHSFLASDGRSCEHSLAVILNKVAVVILDKNIKVSRMMPDTTIYLACDNFERQASEVKDVFEMLQGYDPGSGLVNYNGPGNLTQLPILLGFEKKGKGVVNLEEEVYKCFPQFRFIYDKNVPIAKLEVTNPEIFYENRKLLHSPFE
jgi:hypothetical protein